MAGPAERTAVILEGGSCRVEVVEPALRRGDVTVIGRTANPADAADLVARRRPDLLVVPASSNGWGWLRVTKERVPSLRVLVVGGPKDPERISSALRAGASAYVVAEATGDDFALAVRQSFERSVYLEAAADGPARSPDGVRLTRRETEILKHVALGQSNREIAEALWLTEQTVKFHLSNVYKKLGVRNRTGASRWAHQHGLVTAEVVG